LLDGFVSLTQLDPQLLLSQAELIHSGEIIQQAIARLGREISAVLADTQPLVICVMNGGLLFSGQLIPHFKFPLEIDYIHASRYNGETVGGTLFWHAVPRCSMVGRTVLLLDDILDEGLTLQAIGAQCAALGAQQVYTAVLVEKKLDHNKPIKADFVGLEVPNRYVFGFGMDVNGWWRNLAEIYALR
jgi:hypoxanthine phosphoribosyltransferase